MNLYLDDIVSRDGLSRLPSLLKVSSGDLPHQVRGKRLLQALLLVALVGAGAAGLALLRGHHVMGTTSEISWGVLIATYVFFVVSSTGLCLVSSLGHVFGIKVFEPVAKRAIFLAFVTLLVGFSVIAATKPIVAFAERFSMTFSKPENAPLTMKRMLRVLTTSRCGLVPRFMLNIAFICARMSFGG